MTSRTLLHAPDATPDTRRKVAVSEQVEFSVGATANWVTTSGTAGAAGLATFTWTAPETAGSTTVTATNPATSATCAATIQTILPSTLAMTRTSQDSFPAGTAGAGMLLTAGFPPNDVSFAASEWLEVPGPASNVSGYFSALQRGGTDLSHHPNLSFVPISAANTFASDHAAGSGFPSPWSVGAFDWVIPNKVRRIGGSGAGTTFTNSVQAFRIAANGTVSITKGGASVSRSP
jgi:hypothetical protein